MSDLQSYKTKELYHYHVYIIITNPIIIHPQQSSTALYHAGTHSDYGDECHMTTTVTMTAATTHTVTLAGATTSAIQQVLASLQVCGKFFTCTYIEQSCLYFK